jgi:hypothetical protein
MANAERWAAGLPVPGYAIDDETALKVVDDTVEVDLAGFMLAADPVLAEAAELARIIARAHQGAATQLIGDGWAHARKYFSLGEICGMGGLPRTGQGVRDPRVRTQSHPADPPD